MKTLLLFISFTSFAQSVDGNYDFNFRENRTPNGWSKVETIGKVFFNNNEVTITTNNRVEQLYVKSKQLFIKQDSFIYILVDDDYNECRFRIVVNDTLNTIDLYYYSDRIEEKYYRLKLVKCL